MPITARSVAAQHIARRAGRLAHDLFANRKALAAADRSADQFAAHGDRAVSALIVSKLAAAFPADVFIDGSRGAGAHADRLWMIEGIGGKRNFVRGIPFYSVAIAYAERGCCEAAIVYDPERDEMFHALRDQGAWCEHGGHEHRLELASCAALSEALISVGLDERVPNPAALPARRELIDAGAAARILGAPALELAHVAAGRLDGFVGLGMDPLGLIGALLLVEEAGGHASHAPAAGGIRNDLPIVGCVPKIARRLDAISEAWSAEVVAEPVGMATSDGGRRRDARAQRLFP